MAENRQYSPALSVPYRVPGLRKEAEDDRDGAADVSVDFVDGEAAPLKLSVLGHQMGTSLISPGEMPVRAVVIVATWCCKIGHLFSPTATTAMRLPIIFC